MKRLLLAAVFLSLTLSTQAASAMTVGISDTVTLHGIVPSARYIYLDSNGNIEKVVGNTDNDSITPVIASAIPKPLTATVVRQYQALLAENGGHMQAGETYYPVNSGPYAQFASWLLSNPYFSNKPY